MNGLNMENKKSIRNPFPPIWKVFKYEMKHSVRILLPVYAAIVVIALIAGLLIPANAEGGFDFSLFISSSGAQDSQNAFAGFFMLLYIMIATASAVVAAGVIVRRFKNGLLGDEAYLNLSLPVTIGEHLWGRVATVIVWAIGYIAAMVISAFMLNIKRITEFRFETEWFNPCLAGFCMVVSGALCLIMFIYFINAIAHLAKKHRTLVKLVAIILILTVSSKFWNSINFNYFRTTRDGISMLYVGSLQSLIMSVIYGCGTYFIMKFKLNLE